MKWIRVILNTVLFFRKNKKPSTNISKASLYSQTVHDIDDIKSFMINWNNKYPIDRWWREKYNVPFNSDQHRQMDMYDMRFQFEEDMAYRDIANKKDAYVPGTGNWLKKREIDTNLSQVEIDELFDQIDIDNIKEDGHIEI